MHFAQAEYDLRCEWGLPGLRHVSPGCDAAVIVDVLSFSTAVDIAVARGASVLPYRWKDDSAAMFAEEKHARLAAAHRSRTEFSLSPVSLQSVPPGTALVLPSPNGSALSLSAAKAPTFAACLRNAPAVAQHLAKVTAQVAVISAGERWKDGSLRPCLEDWIGAGAVLSLLSGSRSPEAELAVAAFERFRGDLRSALLGCGSGRELVEAGFRCDVELAAEFGVSPVVPMLAGDRFIDGSQTESHGTSAVGTPRGSAIRK